MSNIYDFVFVNSRISFCHMWVREISDMMSKLPFLQFLLSYLL